MKPLSIKKTFLSKIDFENPENQPEIKRFIQENHRQIIHTEYELRNKEKKCSIEKICAEYMDNISRATFYKWRDTDVTIKDPGFRVISKLEAFEILYIQHLFAKTLSNQHIYRKCAIIDTFSKKHPLLYETLLETCNLANQQAGEINENNFLSLFEDVCFARELSSLDDLA